MFGSKKKLLELEASKEAEIVELEPEPEPLVPGSAEWLASLSQEDYLKMLDHMGVKVQEIFSVPRMAAHQENLLEVIEEILLIARDLYPDSQDIKKFSPLFAGEKPPMLTSFTYQVLFESLNHLLQRINGYGGKWLMDASEASKFLTTVKENRKTLVQARVRQTPFDMLEGLEIMGTTPSLLSRSTGYQMVDDGVREVSRQLAAIDIRMLIVEDQYFVEQVTKSYLPEIIQTADKMRTLTGPAREEASNNFTYQFVLLKAKLESVVKISTERLLDEVRTQSSFMTEALAKPVELKALTVEKDIEDLTYPLPPW